MLARVRRELEQLASDPGPGVSAWPVEDNMTELQAQIQGPAESPFAEGTYLLSVTLPDRYPFEPPRVRFLTPIYHPNIDHDGRICLDTLKMQPQGSWSPSININTVLLTIRMLMQSPNADDGLVPEITEEYKRDVGLWRRKALEHTRKNAVPRAAPAAAADAISDAAAAPQSALGKRERQEDQDDRAQDFLQPSIPGPVAVAAEPSGEDEQSGAGGEEDEGDDDEGFYVD